MPRYRKIHPSSALLSLGWIALLAGCGGATDQTPQCGVASLLALLRPSRPGLTYAEVERIVPVRDGSTSMNDLHRAAAAFDLRLEPRKVNWATFRRSRLRGILHLAPAHFVAITGHQETGVLVVDAKRKGEVTSSAWTYPALRAKTSHGLYMLIAPGNPGESPR